MYSPIHEQIDARVVFSGSKIHIHSFTWNKREYKNVRMNLVWHENHGRNRHTYMGVDDGVNYFTLLFDASMMQWFVEQVG